MHQRWWSFETIMVIAILLLAGCGFGSQESQEAGAAEEQRPAGAQGAPGGGPEGPGGGRPRPTATATEETRSQTVQVAGRLRPRARITHEVPVAGIVRGVAVEPGDPVQSGSSLFSVERNEVGQTFRPAVIVSRIDGVVSEVFVDPEEEVQQGNPGVLVVGSDGYLLKAEISDKDAANLSVGQAVVARTREGQELSGRLTQRSQEPDYDTGLFSLTFRFSEAPAARIGTFVLIELPTEAVTGIFVPRDSVDRRYGRYYLWVVDEEEGVIRRREVTLGDAIGESLVIRSGIEAGTRYLPTLTGREREGAPAGPGTSADAGSEAPRRAGG